MKCIDLFSGCGGMSLGFENAGCEVLAAFDNWEPSVKVYEENFSHPIYKQDLSSEQESIEIIKSFNVSIDFIKFTRFPFI